MNVCVERDLISIRWIGSEEHVAQCRASHRRDVLRAQSFKPKPLKARVTLEHGDVALEDRTSTRRETARHPRQPPRLYDQLERHLTWH